MIKTGPGNDRIIMSHKGYSIIKDFKSGQDEIDFTNFPNHEQRYYEWDRDRTYIGDDHYWYVEIKSKIDFYGDDNYGHGNI